MRTPTRRSFSPPRSVPPRRLAWKRKEPGRKFFPRTDTLRYGLARATGDLLLPVACCLSLWQFCEQAPVAASRLMDMQPLLNFPALGDSGMKHRDTEIFLESLDNIENAKLAALKVNRFRSRMF